MSFIVRFICLCVFIGISISASAESGWYLLIPPTSDYNEQAKYLQAFKVLEKKPLGQWLQQGAYDTASECEATKQTLLMMDQRNYSRTSDEYVRATGEAMDAVFLKHKRLITELDNAKVNAWRYSRCIESNDPRLSK